MNLQQGWSSLELAHFMHFGRTSDLSDRQSADPKIDGIVGILAEQRWKHLVQIGQLLPSWYQLLTFA